MKLNIKKCKAIHFNNKVNTAHSYTMEDFDNAVPITLESATSECDLGIKIVTTFKHSTQTNCAANRVNWILGTLKKAFVSRTNDIWKRLYTTYVRPHLEYAIMAWNPYLIKDKDALESVQRRATKIPHQLRYLSYSDRCSSLGLSTLVDRRARGDLILKYNI
jgi:ribonuclease P/MRP protein subunit RPP40